MRKSKWTHPAYMRGDEVFQSFEASWKVIGGRRYFCILKPGSEQIHRRYDSWQSAKLDGWIKIA